MEKNLESGDVGSDRYGAEISNMPEDLLFMQSGSLRSETLRLVEELFLKKVLIVVIV